MSTLSAIRDRFFPSSSSGPGSDGSGRAAADRDAVPFAGYDRLGDKEVVAGLHDHSQIELEAVEGYERSHRNRESVLDKLRFMRQREPLPGYDGLSAEEIVSTLAEADLATVGKVRSYERKFANRPDVVDEAVRVHRERRAARPASVAPGYQPMSAASAASPGPDPTAKPDRT